MMNAELHLHGPWDALGLLAAMNMPTSEFVRAGSLAELKAKGGSSCTAGICQFW